VSPCLVFVCPLELRFSIILADSSFLLKSLTKELLMNSYKDIIVIVFCSCSKIMRNMLKMNIEYKYLLLRQRVNVLFSKRDF